MKKRLQRITLIVLSGGLYIFVAALGFQAYIVAVHHINVLGVSTVTPLKKEFLLFPEGTKYSMYYELKPNSIEVNDHPWSATGSATYTYNSDSLNERFEYKVEKPQNTYRIVTLGDSFTYGHYVSTSDNWSELLEDILNDESSCPSVIKYEVINLGVPGYDLSFAVERYKRRGYKYKPDMVIWFVNDHHFYAVREIVSQSEARIGSRMTKEDEKKYREQGDYFPAVHQAVTDMINTYPISRLVEQENAALYELADYYRGTLLIVANHISPKYLALLNIFKNYRKDPTFIYKDIPNINTIQNATFPDGHPSYLGHDLYAKDIFTALHARRLICHNDK